MIAKTQLSNDRPYMWVKSPSDPPNDMGGPSGENPKILTRIPHPKDFQFSHCNQYSCVLNIMSRPSRLRCRLIPQQEISWIVARECYLFTDMNQPHSEKGSWFRQLCNRDFPAGRSERAQGRVEGISETWDVLWVKVWHLKILTIAFQGTSRRECFSEGRGTVFAWLFYNSWCSCFSVILVLGVRQAPRCEYGPLHETSS